MAAKQNCIVYVIDDDESIRKSFARLFRSADLDVETFSSPGEFLSRPIEAKNACILLDIRMPGATGFDLQQRLSATGMSLPIIVVSASDEGQVRDTARKLGAVSFFRKPVDDQALLDAVLWAVSVAGKDKNKEK
ncbi:MAG: Transcriptional regulatory protein TdiR [Syntrophorhabdus sp. PtaU1.Bin050]|nr:MAG: Transcriptional regulatory protein TdiR [Syntrophorhabdus sp. PtaU1.Bin050]